MALRRVLFRIFRLFRIHLHKNTRPSERERERQTEIDRETEGNRETGGDRLLQRYIERTRGRERKRKLI